MVIMLNALNTGSFGHFIAKDKQRTSRINYMSQVQIAIECLVLDIFQIFQNNLDSICFIDFNTMIGLKFKKHSFLE